MNWDTAAAVRAILGAVASIATLFCLAKQIRRNSASLDRAKAYAQAGFVHNVNSRHVGYSRSWLGTKSSRH